MKKEIVDGKRGKRVEKNVKMETGEIEWEEEGDKCLRGGNG